MTRLHLTAVLLVLVFALAAFAQTDQPRNGACFYKDVNYRGAYFCAQAGDSLDNLPAGFNDRIRSVRIFGNAQAQVFMDNNFGGTDATFRDDVPDLHAVPLAVDPRANWTERISSLRVSAMSRWGGGPNDGPGACFFEHPNFVGRSFCVNRGDSLENFPAGFQNGVQSIRVFGDADVQIFSDTNYRGTTARLRNDVPELRALSLPNNPSRRWGEQIASVRVASLRGDQWSQGGYRDSEDENRGYDDRNTVRCSSQPGDRPQYCTARDSIRNAYMVNSYSSCRKGVSWGIDDGRLWVSNGCAADFVVRK